MSRRLALAILATISLAWMSLTTTLSATSPTSLEDERLRSATFVCRRAVDPPAAAIPASVLMRARAIAVFPAAALHDGQGVVSARGARVDDWTPPAIVAFEGAYSTDEIVRGRGFFHLPYAAHLWRDALAAYFREMS